MGDYLFPGALARETLKNTDNYANKQHKKGTISGVMVNENQENE